MCLLAGGETTVTVRGDGRGGRNQELAVAAVEPLARFPADAVVASLATDGVDGASDAAGGVVERTVGGARAGARAGRPPAAFLAANDSTNFLAAAGRPHRHRAHRHQRRRPHRARSPVTRRPRGGGSGYTRPELCPVGNPAEARWLRNVPPTKRTTPLAGDTASPGAPFLRPPSPPQPSDGALERVRPGPEGEAAQAYHQRARLAEDRLAEVLGAYRELKRRTKASASGSAATSSAASTSGTRRCC